jgi:hypothetical protein
MPRSALPASKPSSIAGWVALGLIVAAAAVVRVWAAQDAFWLDEVWSLVYYANQARSPLDILVRMPSDNNHHLVTLWMYACGAQDNWFVYRIPSVLAGVGTVVLAWQVCRGWGKIEALVAAWLSASSFVLITYASEARGYALAGFFALAAFLFLKRHLATRGWISAVLFGACVLLGSMSHLTFVLFYTGALTWSLVALVKRAESWPQAAVDLLRLHGLPVILLVAFYLVSLRGLQVGGAPEYVLSDVISKTLALSIGGARVNPQLRWPLAVVAAGLAAAALRCLWMERDDQWIFFLVTLVVAPGLLLLTRPSVLTVRYFYVSIVFFLVLLSYLCGRVYRLRITGKLGVAAALVLILLGNAYHTYGFLKVGRGQYLAALDYILQNSPSAEVHVASDHDFRTGTMLAFYCNYLPDERPVHYHSSKAPLSPQVEWAILHSFQTAHRWPPVFDRDDNRYELRREFPCSGLSGVNWAVYHRVGTAPADR